jgi:hypothetical protein
VRRIVYRRTGILAAAAALAFSAFASVPHLTAAQAALTVSPAPNGGLAGPAIGRHAAAGRPSLPGGVRPACAAPTQPRQMSCMALGPSAKLPGGRISTAATQAPLSATQLQNAYNLASAAASAATDGELVAVVDAYNDPNAVSDLASYRSMEGLPACNSSTEAGCLTIVNQNGQPSPLPGVDTGVNGGTPGGWELEESLDIDMISAICPGCHILLVEANSLNASDLYPAENAAVSYGAKFIGNSWGGTEFPGEYQADSTYFNHPGVAITFAAGDYGYDGNLAPSELNTAPLGTDYPAVSQYVTAVGGTTLTMSGNTRTAETVWSGTGSGCSEASGKPSWQVDTSASGGCLNRTGNDVAAVADPNTPVAVYDSYPYNGLTLDSTSAGGTSVGAPIIAGVYALAGAPKAGTYPSQYPYQHTSAFNAITSGSNGTCESGRAYLCSGTDYSGTTYNAPAGWGTPNGIGAFASTATGDVVTVPDPGTQDYEAGTLASIPVPAVDSASGETLTYSATGLPAGVTINPSTGTIAGTLSSPATSTVTVTATDGTGAKGSVTFNIVSVPNLRTAFHGVSGPVKLDLAGKCLDDTVNSSANGNKIQIWGCNGQASQSWEYVPDGNPGGAGTLQIHGKCADITNFGTANGSKIQLWSCTGAANQEWFLVGAAGELYNPVSGRCLDDTGKSTVNGTQVEIFDCNGQTNQAWTPAASPVLSGVAGKCLDDSGSGSADGNKIDSYSCNGTGAQTFTIGLDGSLQIFGKCLDVTGRSLLDGAPLQLWGCTSGLTHDNQQWVIWAFPVAGAHGAFGEILNANSNKCLAISGNSTANGVQLVQEDCYGSPGEIWALS